MPLLGKKSNISSLSAHTIQKFQSLNITPNRIVISATGIENHQEFVDLVNEKMFLTLLPSK
jgi:predicted Zn-dependent peptidase